MQRLCSYSWAGIGVIFLLLALPLQAQEAMPPKYEFRGTWIATVLNLDWPLQQGDADGQKSNLIAIFDGLQAAGINAVFFQVRPEADALYASAHEPWSFWLTGAQGMPPDPFYDPLTFAIEEAHRRGMELHAWINPYRAVRGSGYLNDANHISVTQPEWTLGFGNLQILDPGLQAVRDYITTIVMDIVRNYEVDGIHFDDFFYPYPPNEITFEDINSFQDDPRGFTDIGDWRRDNINVMIKQVSDSLSMEAPDVVFGISPFGIWRNGVPSGIIGLDAYNVIYGDALAWLGDQSVDYLAPQLYWPFGGAQDYASLANWWASQAFGRHMYMGHGLYRSDPNTFSGSLYDASEVPDQVRFNRMNPEIQGSVFFRSSNLTRFESLGFADSLSTNLYKHPALTPPMDWKNQTAPDTPGQFTFTWTPADEVMLNWTKPLPSDQHAEAQAFVVYRTQSAATPNIQDLLQDASQIIAVTGDTVVTDSPGIANEPYYYVVTAVSSNSIESIPSPFVVVEGRAVSTEAPALQVSTLGQNFPNPFSLRTQIQFSLHKPQQVSLEVYDVTGRRVARIIESMQLPAGTHSRSFEGKDDTGTTLPSGTYYYRLRTGELNQTKGMVLLR